MNKAIIIGRLGRDPETKYLDNGTAITNFSLATSKKWKDKNTGQQKEDTQWHSIVMFGKVAEIAEKYLKKGNKACIEGEIKTRTYEKDGKKQYFTEINALSLELLDPPPQTGQAQSSNVPIIPNGAPEDDIPF